MFRNAKQRERGWGGGGASNISVQYFSQRLKRKETETFKKNIVEFN